MNYARWQLFYEMAATQFAASYAQNRTGSNEDRSVAAERYAASAKVFADYFIAIEGAVLATRPPMPPDPAMMARTKPAPKPPFVSTLDVANMSPDDFRPKNSDE